MYRRALVGAALAKFGQRQMAVRSLATIIPLPSYSTSISPQLLSPLQSSLSVNQKRFAAHIPNTLKNVEERLMLILNLYDKIDNEKLTMDSDFFKDLGLDSLDFVELILELEDEFNCEIPDGDSDQMRTPRHIYRYMCDKFDLYENADH